MDHHKPETRIFFTLLGKYLYKEAKLWRDERGSTSDWRKDPTRLAKLFGLRPFSNAEEIEALFSPNADPSEKVLFLRPTRQQDSILPFLNITFTTNQDGDSKTRLILGMVVKKNVVDSYGFYGYRFESPEDKKNHNFHHIQPVTGIDKNDNISSRFAVDWMPTRFPTFPTPARDSIDLMLLSLMSFHGKEFIAGLSRVPSLNVLKPQVRVRELLERIS